MKIIAMIAGIFLMVNQGNAQSCSAWFNTSNNGNGNYTFLPGSSAQNMGTMSYHTVWDLGDGDTAFYYNQPNITNHTYDSNGSYIVTLNMYFLAPDSSILCTATLVDTLNVTGVTCNLQATIGYYQIAPYTLSLNGYNSGGPMLPFETACWSVQETGFADTSAAPGGQSSLMYTFPDTGYYHVCFHMIDSLSNGVCEDSICQIVYVPYLSCNVSFSMWQDSLNPGTWYAINNSTGNNLIYLWNFGDGTTDTSAYPSHTYSVIGHYDVCLTVSSLTDSCTSTQCDTSSVHKYMANTGMLQFNVINPLGIQNRLVETPDITLYPNPTSGILFIKSELNNATHASVKNNLGEIILQTLLQNKESVIDINGLPSGIYFLHLNDGKNQTVKKFIKE
ncbi:MAG: PKD domain-containing protein [Bacteroidia bacterium]